MKNNTFRLVAISFFFLGCILKAEILTPNEAYKLALENSNKVKSKKFQYLSKKEALDQFYARLYPNISASVNYNEVNYERNELTNSFDPNIEEISLDYMISFKQPIYDHEIYTKIDVEKQRVKLFKNDYDMNAQKLAVDVLTAYLELFKSKNAINLIESYIKYSTKNLDLVEKKFKHSLASKMDFLEAKVELEKYKIELVKEKKKFDINMLKLEQFTNKSNINIPILDLEEFSSNIQQSFREFNYDEFTLDNNLEILNSKLAINLNRLEIKNAFSAHYPKLTFDARYTLYDSDDATTDYENYSKIGVNLEIPLYQGGAISSRVREKELMRSSALEDLEGIKKELDVKLKELKSQLKNSTENMLVFNDALYSAKTYNDSVALGYKHGLKSIIDIYEAEAEVFKIKSDFIQNIQDFIDSYVGVLILTNNLDSLGLIDKFLKE